MRPFSQRFKAILLALGLFLVGLVCGAVADRWVLVRRWRPPLPPLGMAPRAQEWLLKRLSQNLDLTLAQEQEIERILDESRDSIRVVQRQVREEMRTVARVTRSKIREVLTPAQREEYDRMVQRMGGRQPRIGPDVP